MLRLLVKRHHDLVARRTQSICRLHAVLCVLVAGGLARNLTAARAARELRRVRRTDAVGLERRRLAHELVADA